MPFPLAHPAAVLPFRRSSKHYLNFVALLIGSITPDLSYCLEKYDVDKLAHSIHGCFIFSLPVGWVLSLLIGAGTHVFWDSFTHETGWFVERSAFLQSILFSLDGHSFRMYRLLWH